LGGALSKELERARVYREQAASLLRTSERTKNDRQKAMMLDLAAVYKGMAEQLEEIHEPDVGPRDGAEG
jgi:hypothetical protein